MNIKKRVIARTAEMQGEVTTTGPSQWTPKQIDSKVLSELRKQIQALPKISPNRVVKSPKVA